MLEMKFTNVGVVGDFEIKRGVGWKFCELLWRFEKYGYEAYFKDGVFVVINEWITFRALDDRNTIYEVKLSAVEEGKIQFRSTYNKLLLHGGPLEEFEKEDRELDIAAFLKNKNQPGKIMIGESLVKPLDEAPYTETLVMEIDRTSDILRFYLTVTYQPHHVETSSRGRFDWKTDSRIKTLTLDNEVTFDFYNEPFMKVMKQIAAYCERKNVTFTISYREYMLPGHCIEIPHTVIESEDFEIVFEFEEVREVSIAKSIMDSSYYTDSLGDAYNIGDIVRENQREKEGVTYITGYGASNMLKWVFPEDRTYCFCCGFSL